MNRTVLITGSTSGIGLGIARAFAQKGFNIVFNGLETDGDAIAREVAEATGVAYFFSNANMLDRDALRALVDATISRFGSIDVLINNAGIQHVDPIERFPEHKWNDIIQINLSAVFHLTQAVWPYMKDQGFGRIINIASVHGLVASEYKSAYVAAKHGVIGFTKTAALEGAPLGITCNAICPGYVRTPLVDNQIAAQAAAHELTKEEVVSKVMLQKHAIKEFVPVQALATIALFLASEEAATVTGIAIPVDGGWVAQ